MEGNQRVEIALAGDGLVGGSQQDYQYTSAAEAPHPEQARQQQQPHPQKLKGVPQLKAGLDEAGDRHEGHIHQHLRHQPPGLDGEVP